LETARLLAAEHLAYSEHVLAYGEEFDPDRLDAYAAELVGAPVWEFWWD
jgi:hypothetical protein